MARKKLTVTAICRGHQHPSDALALYALARNPDVGRLFVVPLWQPSDKRGETPVVHNCQRLLTDRPVGEVASRHLLGYDLTAALEALGPHARPATPTAQDVQKFLEQALTRSGRQLSDEELVAVKKMELGSRDRRAQRQVPLRPFTLGTLDRSDMVYVEYDTRHFARMHKLLPTPVYGNDPENALHWHSKQALPELAAEIDGGKSEAQHAFPSCANVADVAALRSFMEEHGMVTAVLKKFDVDQGEGVYRVEKSLKGPIIAHKLTPRGDGPELSAEELLKDGPMLAMQWLAPEKGDVRVLVTNGKVLGAYISKPDHGSQMANYTHASVRTPYTLSAPERKLCERVGAALAERGQQHIGIDLLADANGRRFVSEINIGNAGGLAAIHDFALEARHDNNRNAPTVAEQHARGLIDAALNRSKQPAMELA